MELDNRRNGYRIQCASCGALNISGTDEWVRRGMEYDPMYSHGFCPSCRPSSKEIAESVGVIRERFRQPSASE